MIDNANKLMQSEYPLACERISGVNDNMAKSHYHDFYEVYYLESGERFHLLENELHLITPGQFIIFEPYQLHHSYGEENIPFSRLLLYFRKDSITNKEMQLSLHNIAGAYQFSAKDTSILYNYMNEILKEQEEKDLFYHDNMMSLLNQMLVHLFRSQKEKKEIYQSNKVTEIIKYINLNYPEKLTVENLAKQFYISPWHMCREFKYYTNLTIIQYINNIRIIEAQKLLLETNTKITEICHEVGFDNLTHFGRVFKQITGMAPSSCRRKKN